MKKLMIPVIVAVAGIALAPAALADDHDYLEELSSVGMPVSDGNRDVLIQLGQQACVTAHEDPSMHADDLAMQIVEARSAYPFDRARLVVSSALHNYCPDVTATPGV
ncbi:MULTISPECIES: DUF732 domain-containing protein [unclassified Mycolicibacterium]|uniref:DUF732 domain-containing protein n=1 Tax=unclassified Mycolicibacterium TaxID=2636767 RepID=UPI0012DEF07B|nr:MULTISPECIES: DUF732 domain-containing protein [unclassified Mycolicibacterium]MUL85387.1 DUF732 domain-containing protein [Mycolicibacterium sp. CBMA 329]MUL88849.1 DUF732 domain-containing protein [Mycolicibacterium sp. CBMA 331]MUM01877.1 DUF732 domain-containing protein [Mycolicibacterium sp. CBMA 334]MUM27604.1 DUF732 domain-containing protein [Mycolicibacterium sp. CBMA 295]MUM40496.1 DUF732 domain-containing protein [Mycolicibacterium sp. CBMA 247]